jgi:hypothetical protein
LKAFALALLLLTGCVEFASTASTGGYRVVPPPPARAMQKGFAIGVWESNFGEVRIEHDRIRGAGAVIGTWSYFHPQLHREVKGTFQGTLTGTVLRLQWSEGSTSGHGFLEFSPAGDSYWGQWWTFGRSKTGTWRGWRGSRGAV